MPSEDFIIEKGSNVYADVSSNKGPRMLWLLLCSYEYEQPGLTGGIARGGGDLDTEPMNRRGVVRRRSYGVAIHLLTVRNPHARALTIDNFRLSSSSFQIPAMDIFSGQLKTFGFGLLAGHHARLVS